MIHYKQNILPDIYYEQLSEWIAYHKPQCFITLSLPPCSYLTARKLFGHWLARIDNFYLGRNWYRLPRYKRCIAFGFIEGINTANIHIHVLLHLPEFVLHNDVAIIEFKLADIWRKLTKHNTHMAIIANKDVARIVNYSIKEFYKNDYTLVLSDEFHPTRR